MSTARKQYSRKLAAILTVLAMVLALFPVAAFAADGYFKDVGGTLAAEINKAYEAGLVTGYKDGTFRPNEPVTRSAFAKMIVLAVEKATGEELPGGDEPFTDVRPGQALYEYVVKAYNAGYIKGYKDGTFGYDKPINRQEAAAIIQRALELPLTAENFKDVPDNSGFAKQIGAVAAAGIMKGYGGGLFKPAENLPRAQAAAIAYRAYEYLAGKQPGEEEPVEELYEVTAVEQASDSSLRVIFNKAVENTDAVQFEVTRDDETVEVTPEWAEDKTSVELKVDGVLKPGTYTVKVSGLNFAEGKDGGQVTVEGYEVTGVQQASDSSLRVTFNKAVENTDAVQFEVTREGEAVEVTPEWAEDKTSVELKAAATLLNGKYTVTVSGLIFVEGKNTGSADVQTKLTVASIELVNSKQVAIKFTKPVEKASIIESGKLINGVVSFQALEDALPVSVANADAELSNDGTTLTVTAPDAYYFSGEYAVIVRAKVMGIDGSVLEEYSKVHTFVDETRPTVVDVTADATGEIKVVFSEPVKIQLPADETAKAFSLSVSGEPVPVNVEGPAPEDHWTSVTLSVEGRVAPDKTYTLSVNGYVQDFAGNLIAPNPTQVEVKFPADVTPPRVEKIEPVDLNTFLVYFSEPIEAGSVSGTIDKGLKGTELLAFNDEPDATDPWDAQWMPGGKVLRIDLNLDALRVSETFAGRHEILIESYKDLAGNVGDPFKAAVDFEDDDKAPEVHSVSVEVISGQRYIIVTFDELLGTIDEDAVIGIKEAIVDGVLLTPADGDSFVGTISGASAYDPDEDGLYNQVMIRAYGVLQDQEEGELPAGEYTLTLPAGLVADLAEEGSTNEQPNPSVETDIKVTLPPVAPVEDRDAPTVLKIWPDPDNNDYVYVEFDETVSNATALNAANYTVDGQPLFVSAVFVPQEDPDKPAKSKVRLTLQEGAIKANGLYRISVRGVADLAGNTMAPYSEDVELTENVKPEVVDVRYVDPDTIEITFSEPVNEPTPLVVKFKGQPLESDEYVLAAVGTVKDGRALKWSLDLVGQRFTSKSDVLEIEFAAGSYSDANGNPGRAGGPYRVTMP